MKYPLAVPTKMICQDCLRVRPYTFEGHVGEERCECGGDFCGCEACQQQIACLEEGDFLGASFWLQKGIIVIEWDASKGGTFNDERKQVNG